MNEETQKIIEDCGDVLGHHDAIKQEDIVPTLSIEDLLQKNDFEKHIGGFELPQGILDIMTADEVNAVITWYHRWQLREPADTQNTCTIKDLFGEKEAIRVIVAINFYKYLRNKGYDPDIVDIFLRKQ